MNTDTYQTLKQVQKFLYATLILLMLTAVLSLLSSVMHYFIAVVIATLLVAFHWLTRNNSKVEKWRKAWSMIVPAATILAPIIYLFLLFFVYGSATKWLLFLRFCSVVVPMLFLMYAIYRLQKLIEQL